MMLRAREILAITLLVLISMINLDPTAALADAPQTLDPRNGTWHIGLDKLWGINAKGEGRRLDIYPVFVDGKWVNALATAREFNTSIHLIEESDVRVDLDAGTVKGKIKLLVTPDTWIPKDGQAFYIEAEIDGKLNRENEKATTISGSYKAWRTDGQPIYDDVKVVEANLIGACGHTELGWEDSRWSFSMNQVVDPDELDHDLITLELGIAAGKVNWGRLGITPSSRWPTVRQYSIDVSPFAPVGTAGIVKGSVIVTGRHLHPGGDPATQYRLDIEARRVQGLTGGKATITRLDDNDQPTAETWIAAGRGGASKGGGAGDGSRGRLWTDELNTDPWWMPVKNHKAVAAGEHPRLLFRKSDLPRLRERAQTETGQQIIAQLRHLLGSDGEALPTRFNETPAHNHNKSPKLPDGTFTTWHAAGFGFLYQLTGDKKYAELAKGCVEMMLEGKMDIDNRYGWATPGTDLRCGSVLAAMAYAYDFCYDAWPEDFRRKIALEIQDFDKVTASAAAGAQQRNLDPATTDIKKLVGRTGYPPGSNHYGSLIGGTGVALLAILGDPGVDDDFVKARLAEIESNIPRMLDLGFGDAGFYAEGLPPSRLSTNGGLMELFHALRSAAGRDYIASPRQNAQWLTLRWVPHLGGNNSAQYPNRGTYGDDRFYQKGGLSGGGDFAFGFGAIPAKYQPALLWTYENTLKQAEIKEKGRPLFDAERYPHRAIYAFLNWPIDQKPVNPAELLPLTVVDRIHGYVIARNRYKDNDDLIVTHHLYSGPRGYYAVKDGKRLGDRPGVLRIWGHGLRTEMTTNTGDGHITAFAYAQDGSFTMTQRGSYAPTGLAVDFSQASGAQLVIVAIGDGALTRNGIRKERAHRSDSASLHRQEIEVAGTKAYVLTLQTGQTPEIKVDGKTLHVGKQTFAWDGQTLTMGQFTPVAE